MQPTALMYKISNLDRDKAKDFLATRENRLILLERAKERAKADGEEGEQVVYVGAGTYRVNLTVTDTLGGVTTTHRILTVAAS